jgi:hypothetical protein
MGDSDIGEMFLNLMLEENCACLVVVDLTHYILKGELAEEGRRHLVQCSKGRACQRDDHGRSK